jgi:hypothetical protein
MEEPSAFDFSSSRKRIFHRRNGSNVSKRYEYIPEDEEQLEDAEIPE